MCVMTPPDICPWPILLVNHSFRRLSQYVDSAFSSARVLGSHRTEDGTQVPLYTYSNGIHVSISVSNIYICICASDISKHIHVSIIYVKYINANVYICAHLSIFLSYLCMLIFGYIHVHICKDLIQRTKT